MSLLKRVELLIYMVLAASHDTDRGTAAASDTDHGCQLPQIDWQNAADKPSLHALFFQTAQAWRPIKA